MSNDGNDEQEPNGFVLTPVEEQPQEVQNFVEILQRYMSVISTYFHEEMKLTFVARHPDFPDRTVVSSEDDLTVLADALREMHRAKKAGMG